MVSVFRVPCRVLCGGLLRVGGGVHREFCGANHTLVLEVQEQAVMARGRGSCHENDLRACRGDSVARCTLWVDVKVTEVANPQRHQVSVGG